MRQGEKAWYQLYKLDNENKRIHNKYNGQPTCGFDIAVCAYSEVNHEYSGQIKFEGFKNNLCWCSAKPETLEVGYKIEVVGYPGDKDLWPYYQRGEITDVKKKNEGGWILYYDIDTTPGMSGSPIMIVD